MADEIIAHPTYMEHVRHFFEEIDLDHMNAQGVDLSTYALLSARANDVYLHQCHLVKSVAGVCPLFHRTTRHASVENAGD
jgi:uncharacterized protein YigA (DUF484 family)